MKELVFAKDENTYIFFKKKGKGEKNTANLSYDQKLFTLQ